ncbi:MAG: 2Fe-2S iron-sulfur cluster-binding protein [Treponema sp.]|nr:2Fe-2S iron-sulfur cluster-binding protein [Treponema sp.]
MGKKHKVAIQGTDITFECDEDAAVLHAMIHHGKGPVVHGCCGGGCGVCKARIVSGDFFAFKPMSAAHVNGAEKKQGLALLCCVQPRSDMLIAKR